MEHFDAIASGQKLKELRGNRSQTEVARALGLTAMAISAYENGKRVPPDPIKCALANYYGQSVSKIFFASK